MLNSIRAVATRLRSYASNAEPTSKNLIDQMQDRGRRVDATTIDLQRERHIRETEREFLREDDFLDNELFGESRKGPRP